MKIEAIDPAVVDARIDNIEQTRKSYEAFPQGSVVQIIGVIPDKDFFAAKGEDGVVRRIHFGAASAAQMKWARGVGRFMIAEMRMERIEPANMKPFDVPVYKFAEAPAAVTAPATNPAGPPP